MQRMRLLAALAALLVGTMHVSAANVWFHFQDGTDQGFGHKFSNDASESFPIVAIGGSSRMEVLRNGDFQEADHGGSDQPFLDAFNAAVANPSDYLISYDWYVDTSLSPGNYGTFLQIGTYINAGQGSFPYQQDFPGVGKDVELNGTQLASGGVFSGTVSETLTTKYGAIHADFQNAPFQRLGLIINGDGSQAKVYFDNIRIHPIVPEPASLALIVLAAPLLAMWRRR
jgi:hypothetical protein